MRWGLGDFFWVFLAQLVGAVIGDLIALGVSGTRPDGTVSQAAFFWIVVPAQAVAGLGAVWLISRRKGRGSVALDFGLGLRRRDWVGFPMGLGLQIAFALVLLPFFRLIHPQGPSQELVSTIEEAHGPAVWVAIVLGVTVLQPLLEELMFRGILLRALLRRTSPEAAILISGAVFGLVHLTGVAPSLAAVATIVGLTGLGIVLGIQVLRSGSIGRAYLIHAGFNLAALLLSFTT